MKSALSRILEFFVGYDRRKKSNPMHQSYCICGALKPPELQDLEASSNAEGRPQG